MMTLQQIASAAGALGNQLGAGIPLAQAVGRMSRLQPVQKEYWLRVAAALQSGQQLSSFIGEVWPRTLVSVVKAGEEAGTLAAVLHQIEETVELQMKLRGKMMGLAYPFGMGAAGLAVFMSFMIFVLPLLAKSIGGKKSTSLVFQFSTWLSVNFLENWMLIVGGLVVGAVALVSWIRTEKAQELIIDLLLQMPMIKDALRDMYFGLWATYMSMMVNAGIPTVAALNLTAPVMPGVLADSVRTFANDIGTNNRSLSDSADVENLPPDDLRVRWWPFFISSAFVVAEQTGRIDRELMRVSPALIKDGTKSLERLIAILNLVSLAASAFLIVSPLAAYYSEIFTAIRTAA